jgi:hypothetical protein
MPDDAKLPNISRRSVLKAGGAVAATALGASAVARPNIVLALNKVRIVIVPKGFNNPVFKIADLSGQQRANELGNVEFRFTGSPQSDGAQQVAAIDVVISAAMTASASRSTTSRPRSTQAPIHRRATSRPIVPIARARPAACAQRVKRPVRLSNQRQDAAWSNSFAAARAENAPLSCPRRYQRCLAGCGKTTRFLLCAGDGW